jgi:CheY-like chemotaxis protein
MLRLALLQCERFGGCCPVAIIGCTNALQSKSMETEAPLILVADDVPLNLEILATLMQQHGFRYECAKDGLKALAAARARRFDLLVFDIRMPGLLGFEVLQELRADRTAASHDSPAITVTGENDDDGFFDFLRQQGFIKVIQKPWENDDLMALIHRLARPQARFASKGSMFSDPEKLLKLRRMFCEDLKQRLPQLERDYLGPPIEYRQSVREAVHRLKGAVGFVGTPALGEAVERFRREQSMPALHELKIEARAIIAAIEASN